MSRRLCWGGADLLLFLPIYEQSPPKRLQPCGEQPHIVADGAQEGVDGITISALEAVSFEQAVAFEVTDDRFDGASSFAFALDCG
jgi:hypothetical protein